MKRKRWVIFTVLCVLLGGYTAGIYGQTDKITKKQILYLDEKKNEEDVAKKVLKDTDRTDSYDLNDLENVMVFYGNVNGEEEKDAVICVNIGGNNTIVAAYTSSGDAYEYLGDIGNFYDVDHVQFVSVNSLEKDIVLVNEVVNQQNGVNKVSNFLGGYLFGKENDFYSVLHTPIQVELTWNEVKEKVKEPISWKRFAEKAETSWKSIGETTKLDIVRYQSYMTAPNKGEQLPEDSQFIKQDSRVITEEFYWSDQWQRFIIGEAIEEKTGQPVAVLENSDNGPYVLAGFVENCYLIQRKDGYQDIVHVDELKWTKKPKESIQKRD